MDVAQVYEKDFETMNPCPECGNELRIDLEGKAYCLNCWYADGETK